MSAYWHCPKCKKWETHPIPKDAVVICRACGKQVDLSCAKTSAYISYQSRRQQIKDLCHTGSEWENEYQDIIECFCDFLTEYHAGRLPKRTTEQGYRYFSKAWKSIEELAAYLLSARDAPAQNLPYAYSEVKLTKRYYDSRRACNVRSANDLNFGSLSFGDGDGQGNYSNLELAEMLSLRHGYAEPFYDDYFSLNDFCIGLSDKQRQVVKLLHAGHSKTEISKKLSLTERQLRTQIKHIGAVVKNNL